MNDVFAGLNRWIKANKLAINFVKTNFMKLCTTNKNCVNLRKGYVDKIIEEVETTKFLGLQADNNLNWKTHVLYIIPKLSSACFAMRTIASLMKTETLKLVYFAYFYSIVSYGII
jgi:vacuolar-type H+-ATPase subunit B/Vma2